MRCEGAQRTGTGHFVASLFSGTPSLAMADRSNRSRCAAAHCPHACGCGGTWAAGRIDGPNRKVGLLAVRLSQPFLDTAVRVPFVQLWRCSRGEYAAASAATTRFTPRAGEWTARPAVDMLSFPHVADDRPQLLSRGALCALSAEGCMRWRSVHNQVLSVAVAAVAAALRRCESARCECSHEAIAGKHTPQLPCACALCLCAPWLRCTTLRK